MHSSTIAIGPHHWFLSVSRNMSFWHQHLSTQGNYLHMADYGIDTPQEILFLSIDGLVSHIFLNEQNARAHAQSLLRALDSAEKIHALEESIHRTGNELLTASDLALNVPSAENFERLCEKYVQFTPALQITNVLGREGSKQLEIELQKIGYAKEAIPEIESTITYPSTHTPLFRSQRELLAIGASIQTGKDDGFQEKALEEWLHQNEYIPVNFQNDPWTLFDAKQQLDEALQHDCAKEIARLDTEHEKRVTAARDQLARINDTRVTTLAFALQKGTELNEYRKNTFSRSANQIRTIFQRLAPTVGLNDWKHFYSMTAEQIKQTISTTSIAHLPAGFPFRLAGGYMGPHGYYVLSIAELTTLETFLHAKPEEITGHEILVHGKSANPGIARGKAKIVSGPADFQKFHRGDILVARMTSVDFVPLMEKAAAFVTNEGGITSHASIVAREMGKPCVIGTIHATSVFKDNDELEVDAHHGVVRKIFP